MKRILLILTGGTIASVETEQGLRPGISAGFFVSKSCDSAFF